MANQIKNFGNLKPGDKVYDYYFSDGCVMNEHEIVEIDAPNEYGYCLVTFGESSYPHSKYLPARTYIDFDNDKVLEIWSTDGTLMTLFTDIFNNGVKHSQRTIWDALGLNC